MEKPTPKRRIARGQRPSTSSTKCAGRSEGLQRCRRRRHALAWRLNILVHFRASLGNAKIRAAGGFLRAARLRLRGAQGLLFDVRLSRIAENALGIEREVAAAVFPRVEVVAVVHQIRDELADDDVAGDFEDEKIVTACLHIGMNRFFGGAVFHIWAFGHLVLLSWVESASLF